MGIGRNALQVPRYNCRPVPQDDEAWMSEFRALVNVDERTTGCWTTSTICLMPAERHECKHENLCTYFLAIKRNTIHFRTEMIRFLLISRKRMAQMRTERVGG